MQPLEKMEKRIRAALAGAPHSAHLLDELGANLARQQRHVEAIALFERALSLDPELPHTRKRLANAYAASGRGLEADRLYAEYVAQDPDRKIIAEGAEHLNSGRTKQAVAAFKGVLRRIPDHIDAMRMLALALGSESRDIEDAEVLLRRVTERAPDYVAAWIDLGSNYIKQKKWVEAPKRFAKRRGWHRITSGPGPGWPTPWRREVFRSKALRRTGRLWSLIRTITMRTSASRTC